MRKTLFLLPLLLSAAPALAQESPAPIKLPRELTDPQSAMKLAIKLQALSNALMNIKVGDFGAALEGREASPQERNMTVGDLVRRKDPDFDRHVQEKVASVGPKVIRGMHVLQHDLPKVMHDLDDAQKSVERVVSNLPDPTYPVR